MAYPDITLTGEEIHNAFCVVAPAQARAWNEISLVAQQHYDALAQELNRELNARLAWAEGEDVTVSAVRCPQCKEMLQAEHAEGHACWQEVR